MLWEILALTGGLIALGVYGIVAYNTRDKSTDIKIKPNLPYVINLCRRDLTDGHSILLLQSRRPASNGCDLLELIPQCIDQTNTKKELIKIYPVVARRGSIETLGKGEASPDRDIVLLSGRSKLDLPDRLRSTLEGNLLSVIGQKAFIEKLSGGIITVGDEAIGEAMRIHSRTGATRNALAEMQERAKKSQDAQSRIVEEAEKK